MKNFIDLKCDYNLYKSFFAVAKLDGFSAAAKALFVSQPSISYNIKTLEKQLGVTLFYRNSKNINLTPEGKKLYDFIDQAHNLLISGEKMLFDSSALITGSLAIGAPTHIANFFLTNIIKEFHNHFPNIVISVFSRSTSEMISMLEDNVLDLVVDSLPIDERNNIEKVSIGSVESCFAYSTSKYDKQVKNKDIEFILPNQYTGTRKQINTYLQDQNIELNCMFEISTTETTLNMVLEGMGVGYFLRPSIEQLCKEGILSELKFKVPLPKVELAYVFNKNFVSSATKTFIKLIEEHKWQN